MCNLKFIKQGYFTFKIGDSLSQKTKEIPKGYGVYKIYANSINGELLYIGKGGTVHTDGSFDKQSLKERLNNKQENMRREKFFIKKINEDKHLKALYIEWFIIDEKLFLPAYYEAALIQDYYSKHSKLPKWNKKY
jgi:hypothetical protein